MAILGGEICWNLYLTLPNKINSSWLKWNVKKKTQVENKTYILSFGGRGFSKNKNQWKNLSKRNQSICPHTDLHLNCSSFICSSPQTGNNPHFSSLDKWLNKLLTSHTTQQYKGRYYTFGATWMDLETIILRELSHNRMISLTCRILKNDTN